MYLCLSFFLGLFMNEIISFLNLFFNTGIVLNNRYFKGLINFIFNNSIRKVVLIVLLYTIFIYFLNDFIFDGSLYATDNPVDSSSTSSNTSPNKTWSETLLDKGKEAIDAVTTIAITSAAIKGGVKLAEKCPAHIGVGAKVVVGCAACLTLAGTAQAGILVGTAVANEVLSPTAAETIQQMRNNAKDKTITKLIELTSTVYSSYITKHNVDLTQYPFSLLTPIMLLNKACIMSTMVILNSYIVNFIKSLNIERFFPDNKIGNIFRFMLNKYFTIWEQVSKILILISIFNLLWSSLVIQYCLHLLTI